MKIVKIELKDEHEKRFNELKDFFGVSLDTETIRLALKKTHESVFKKTFQDSEIENKVMDLFYQGFFDEFLEELKENDPELLQKYIESRKVKPKEKGEVSP